jgi:hypothetical protein
MAKETDAEAGIKKSENIIYPLEVILGIALLTVSRELGPAALGGVMVIHGIFAPSLNSLFGHRNNRHNS